MPDQLISQSTSQLVDYLLHLADNALILGHRNSEWCGHGPVLEQDIAISNISLDLIGQARNFYQYVADLQNDGSTEDSFAYHRDVRSFRNCLLVELPKADWAQTIGRQFFFSNYQYLLYQQLQNSKDERLAAIAAKSLKEVTYHLRWSSEWVIRLGDGTRESRERMELAVDNLWSYTGELLSPAEYEMGREIDWPRLGKKWLERSQEVLSEAGLSVPGEQWMQTGGKLGQHSEHLGYILAELQFIQRSYPNLQW